jgi:hypothetical protein
MDRFGQVINITAASPAPAGTHATTDPNANFSY